MQVHQFESTTDAYDAVNMGYWRFDDVDLPVNDGDVLVVASEGIIGFAYKAWPVAIVYPGWMSGNRVETGAFHVLGDDVDIKRVGKREEVRKTIRICPPGEEPFDQENVFPADPGTDYSASKQRCIDVAKEDADITGNEHWGGVSE